MIARKLGGRRALHDTPSIGTPDLARLVIERELTPRLLVLVLCTVVAAAAVAAGADAAVGGTSTLADAVVRRFDLTILWLSAILAGARIALNFETDERDEWLDAFVAAGASRRRYVAGVGFAGFGAAAAIFVSGATSFAVSVLVIHDSGELTRQLPRTLLAGSLVLAHWCLWFTLIGVITRRVLLSIVSGIAIAAAPTVVMFIQLKQNGFISDGVLHAMLLLPPLVWGGSLDAQALELLAMVSTGAIAVACADRLTGRHA